METPAGAEGRRSERISAHQRRAFGFSPQLWQKERCEQELHGMMVTMATPTPSIQASICLALRAGKDTLLLLKADGNLSSLAGSGWYPPLR